MDRLILALIAGVCAAFMPTWKHSLVAVIIFALGAMVGSLNHAASH